MSTYQLPMPGERFDGRIVIASCYGRDEGDELDFDTLLLLNDTPDSYYSVVEVSVRTSSVFMELTYPNIVPAAEGYQEYSEAWGGDSIGHDITGRWFFKDADPQEATG